MDEHWVLCADIGSVRANKFGWYGVQLEQEAHSVCGTSIDLLAETVADKLTRGSKVSLGFACPLFVPVRIDDARIAVDRFRSLMPTPQDGNAIREESVLSLIGTALIRAGWSRDIALVFEPCVVVKA